MMHSSDWDDWQYVLAVMECGSLSGAARSLGVNHATVLRRINAVEACCQLKLFDRRQNGCVPTPDCLDISSQLQGLGQSVQDLELAIRNSGNPFSGKVRVTSTDTICQYILPKHLWRLKGLHPGLAIELLATNRRLDLSEADAEITIRPTMELSDDLAGRQACNLVMEVFGSPEYLRKNNRSRVEDHRWLGLSEVLIRSPVRKWEQEANLQNVVFRSDSFITLAQAAENGLGLAMMPSFIGNASDMLVRAEQFCDRLELGLWVACHQDRAGSARITALLDYFFDAMRADRKLFEGDGNPLAGTV